MKPTWLTTEPTVPPFAGGSSPRFRLTDAGNITVSALPRMNGLPPMAEEDLLVGRDVLRDEVPVAHGHARVVERGRLRDGRSGGESRCEP